MNLSLLILILFSIINFSSPISALNPQFTACNRTFHCGNLTNITYPFYDGNTRPDYCGYPGLKLDCNKGSPQISISSQLYNLLSINKTANTIQVSLKNFNSTNACPYTLRNTTIDYSIFKFSPADQNITFYGCDQVLTGLPVKTECESLESGLTGYYMTSTMLMMYNGRGLFGICKSAVMPILQSAAKVIDKSQSRTAIVNAFEAGFELDLIVSSESSCDTCVGSGGACGLNSTSQKFVCYCPDANFNVSCGVLRTTITENGTPKTILSSEKPKLKVTIILYSAISGFVAFILLVLFIIYWQRGKIKGSSTFLSRDKFAKENRNVKNALKIHASLTPKRCSYSDIKKMTNSFTEKLGEGGFGGVYKGKLLDGRLVAVKLLKGSKGNGEGFINEVASIGMTNHVNVVNLLGFCFEGNKRALVYEYMANGSLEKFMHGKANNGHSSLSLETLFEIVLGIARGLEYLHRGCQTRILHFDIKPHNILLDEEFRPKISDFGLAKLTPQDKQSKVSMSGTRGTIGYIAPEVFCRSFGDVSHKSDVYSYGMMVLEVIGSRKREDTHQVESSSEQYFPNWIYKQLQQGDEVGVDISMNDTDKELKRKMIVISLWCIQPVPSSRPSMSRVVQMLEGRLESIEIPPMPSHSSPPRLQWDPSMSSTMTT